MKSILLLLLFASLHFIGKAQAMKINYESTDVTLETHHLASILEATLKSVIGTAELITKKMGKIATIFLKCIQNHKICVLWLLKHEKLYQ